MKEIWKDVLDYEGYYQVSSMGNVRSVRRKDRLNRKWGGHTMSPCLQKNGYKRIELNKDGKPRKWGVHQLVAAAFLGRCPDSYVVNHRDGNPSNNTIGNLEYVTRSENCLHSTQVLNRSRGENHYKSILTEADVIEMKVLRKQGLTYSEIGKRYSVSLSTAQAAINGQNWYWVE